MTWDPHAFKIGSAYVVTVIFVIAAIILLGILSHLIYVANKKCKKKSEIQAVMFFLIITLCGIISFFLSLLCIILVVVQLILIDGHKLHPESNKFHKLFYSMFEELEYMIAIFDAFGHLCMLTVFIVRFEICFKNSVFGYSKCLLKIMYSILFILFSCSIVIIIEIIHNDKDTYLIIISEIIWELLIEAMALWLLYLFVSKLYKLLKMTLAQTASSTFGDSKKHKSDISIFNDLVESMTPKLERSRSHSKSGSSGKNKTGSKNKSKSRSKSGKKSKKKNQNKSDNEENGDGLDGMDGMDGLPAMTIDGKMSEPVSVISSAYDMDNIDTTKVEIDIHSRIEEEPMSMYSVHQSTINRNGGSIMLNNDALPPGSTKLQHNPSSNHSDVSFKRSNSTRHDPQIVDLVNVMNKMTLLVIISVLSSILSVIGNIFVEIHELETIAEHDVNVQSMWAFLLPVSDMIITSFMLYLQFNFTQNIYSKMCYELDICFLKLCLKLNLYFLKKRDDHSDDIIAQNLESHSNLSNNPSAIDTTTNSSRFSKAISSANTGCSDIEQSPALTAIKDDAIDAGIEIVTVSALTPANSQILRLEPANSRCPLNDDISSNPNSEIDISDNPEYDHQST